jgi:hypothetical protein
MSLAFVPTATDIDVGKPDSLDGQNLPFRMNAPLIPRGDECVRHNATAR